MASTDVIELGSSEDEAEPAPKRRKPPLNAMVHIPNMLPSGVTVTSSKNKSRINPSNILKGALSQSLIVKKIPKKHLNPYANAKFNGNPIKTSATIKQASDIKPNVAGHIHKDNNFPLKRKITQSSSKMMTPFGLALNKCATNKNTSKQTGSDSSNIVKLVQPGVGRTSELKLHLTNTSLPPGITIKRTTPQPKNINPIAKKFKSVNTPFSLVKISNISSVKQTTTSGVVLSETMQTAEVPTVNLDDDEPTTSSSFGPQWYLRPEELNKKEETKGSQKPLVNDSSVEHTDEGATKADSVKKSDKTSPENAPETAETLPLEKQNNKEPDKTTYIEITIEDSPIKPQKVKKGFKVGSELAITIDDSPIKNVNAKASHSNSEDEEDQLKTHNSKKKLEYPKTVQAVEEIEIEFEPYVEKESKGKNNAESSKEEEKSMTPTKEKETAITEKSLDSSNTPNAETKTEKPKRVVECIDIVEIEESPVKPAEETKITTPKKNKPTKPVIKMTEMETIDLKDEDEDKEKDEFTSIYQSFIKLCFQLENSEDMKKIVEKKIKGYYRQVPKDYTESETFTDLVSSKIIAMKASPEKMYLYIKDVVDELNLQRKLAKAQPVIDKEEQQKFLYGEESEFDAKRQRQIRKLEKTLKKLHRAIQKLEEQEVDFDDEEDSVYLLTESEDDTSTKDDRPLNKEVLIQRYKERSVRVHAKLCQLTNTKMPSEARVQIDPRPNQPKGPSKRLEKWINRKVPIGAPLPFPDFHDVLRCVREANQEDKLGWNEADVMEEARDLFVRCGKKLQRRRQENEWRLAASRVPADMADPAENSADLKKKLEENRRLAAKKETEVFNKFADRQNQLKLEAVEIGDKEAEESPVESDDEEHAEVSDSLTDKEKRKERLKRLLHEKSKVSDVKENQEEKILSNDKSSQDDSTKDSNKAEIGTKDSEDRKDSVKSNLPDGEPSNIELIKDNKDNNLSDSNRKKDDGNKVDSDVDELHLLEKLYSDNEYNNAGSSDTASPIAISDTSSMNDKTSSDECRTKKTLSDVISIENSSYSESEEKNPDSVKETDGEKNVEKPVVPMELDFSVDIKEKISDETNTENRNGINSPSTSSKEDVLLASSDEGNDTEPPKDKKIGPTCINLKDDNISIGETLIIENRDLDDDSEASKADNSEKNTITDSSSVEGMEIGPAELNSKDQNLTNDIVETVSVESLIEENASTLSSTKSPENKEDRSPTEITNISSVETISDDHANIENVEETVKTNLSNAINKVTTDVVQRIDKDKVDNETCCKPNTTTSETIENLEESYTNQTSENQRHETESNLNQTESHDLRDNSECADDIMMEEG